MSSFGMKNDKTTKNIADTMIYGKSNKKNNSKEILETVYITILWGAPIGRTIQPILAAIVCKDTVIIIKSNRATFLRANIEKGTKIINETSLVMNIELKKQVKTNNKTSSRVFRILANNLRTNISKIDKFFKTSTIIIITKSNMIVSQLM